MKIDGRDAPALPAGQRTVLGILALSAGTAVTRDSIIGALWPQDPPLTAASIVQTYVSRLRGFLRQPGCRRDYICRDASGYRLDLAADSLDFLAFRQIAVQARASADANQACLAYERAMRLWRGGPLEDVEALRAHPAVTAAANEHTDVALAFADRAAGAGQHESVLRPARPGRCPSWCASWPGRKAVWRRWRRAACPCARASPPAT